MYDSTFGLLSNGIKPSIDLHAPQVRDLPTKPSATKLLTNLTMEGRESARCALKWDVSGLQSIRYASGISVASDHRKVWMNESFAQVEQKLRSIDTRALQRHP